MRNPIDLQLFFTGAAEDNIGGKMHFNCMVVSEFLHHTIDFLLFHEDWYEV
jgi:hypothetical protein